MSVEEAVRRKHDFERALKDYLQFISVMSREEIELSLGRLADHLNRTNDETEAFHVRVKGAVLKIYLELRRVGIKKQSKMKRMTLRPAMKRFFIDRGHIQHFDAVKCYEIACKDHEEKMTEWKQGLKTLPLIKRLFAKPSPPDAPKLPLPVEHFVKRSIANADMSEYLIASAAQYHLVSMPQRVEDINRTDITELAP